jgi:hypothetical protein
VSTNQDDGSCDVAAVLGGLICELAGELTSCQEVEGSANDVVVANANQQGATSLGGKRKGKKALVTVDQTSVTYMGSVAAQAEALSGDLQY